MECIDGSTLLDVLRQFAPLPLERANDIAGQLLAGLQAIHDSGLVHRDLKPENVMITRSNRVVIMDFGVARATSRHQPDTVSGTPAYMSPEHALGQPIDARADIFSAAVLLAEMIAPGGIAAPGAREKIWRATRSEPIELTEHPWSPVLRRALARERDERFARAADLARALEETTLRTEGAERLRPYPGLAPFGRLDAEFFFGREPEIEALWSKLRHPRLHALIGPSGAGKSSFLRAGFNPGRPSGWTVAICTPGRSPTTRLGQALSGDPPSELDDGDRSQLPGSRDDLLELAARWRRGADHALVIVDQFEELFTQNEEDVQEAFAELLGDLVLQANVHVLLSMRDDFLLRCSEHPSLAPLFSAVTPLRRPGPTALRRAVVLPAQRCGYRFDDETLVDEMIHEVASERAALPMLAFATAQLWDRRDREGGRLTRTAYASIGGVTGALAQHAEATLEEIGRPRVPLVRTLLAELATAEGARLTREREQLLSAFESRDRAAADEVLDALVDARLLTAYESSDEEGPSRQSVEIAHESLLTQWPRLARWRSQDADRDTLRDQLRLSAHLWDARGRPRDLLWSDKLYDELRGEQGRVALAAGGVEQEFIDAMDRRAKGQPPPATGGHGRGTARRRHPAVRGGHRLDPPPRGAAGVGRGGATTSRAGTPRARRAPFAIAGLRDRGARAPRRRRGAATRPRGRAARAPPDRPPLHRIAGQGLQPGRSMAGHQHPDRRPRRHDQRPAVPAARSRGAALHPARVRRRFEPPGRAPPRGEPHPSVAARRPRARALAGVRPRDRRAPGVRDPGAGHVHGRRGGAPACWFADGARRRSRSRRSGSCGSRASPPRSPRRATRSTPSSTHPVTASSTPSPTPRPAARRSSRWPSTDRTSYARARSPCCRRSSASGSVGSRSWCRPTARDSAPSRRRGSSCSSIYEDRSRDSAADPPRRRLGPVRSADRAHGLDRLDGSLWLWDLRAPREARPIVLKSRARNDAQDALFHPSSGWVAAGGRSYATLWPLADSYPTTPPGETPVRELVVSPNGEWLAALAEDDAMGIWSLDPDRDPPQLPVGRSGVGVDIDPGGRFLAWSAKRGAKIVPLGDGRPTILRATDTNAAIAISPTGEHVATLETSDAGEPNVRLWRSRPAAIPTYRSPAVPGSATSRSPRPASC